MTDDGTPGAGQHAIDDGALRADFASRLGALADAGRTRAPRELLDDVVGGWEGLGRLPAPTGPELSPEAIYRHARDGVVAVGKLYVCTRCGGRHVGVASGFAVAADVVVTARHVVDDDERLALGVMSFDGTVRAARAVLAESRLDDLAVLRVEGAPLRPLAVGDEPGVGAPVHVLSHVAGRLFVFGSGLISRYAIRRPGRRDADADDSARDTPTRVMSITAEFGRGSSGAPVLDRRAAVVGVALRTRSIHHHGSGEEHPRLQTVLRACAPAGALRALGIR